MKNEQTPPQKPFVLCHEEAENKIFDAVNEAAEIEKIPFFLIEGMLTNILHQVRERAKIERESAIDLYEKQLAEYYEAEKEGEECKKQ